MTSIPSKPVLSNRLADLAERAGQAARAWRRGSIESIHAYLDAGGLLAEARGECRRGEWGAVLQRAGIADRTGRLMVQCWRIARETGSDAVAIHEAGGVQAFVAAAVGAAQGALHAAAESLEDDEGEPEKPALNAGIEGGEAPPEPAPEGVPAREPGHAPSPAVPDSPARGVGVEIPPAVSVWCRCGRAVAPGRRSCPECLERDRNRNRRRLAVGGAARRLGERLERAARDGTGIRLTAEDVAGLLGAGRRRRAAGSQGPLRGR